MNKITATLTLVAFSLTGCQNTKPVDPDTVYLEAAQVPKRTGTHIKLVRIPVPTPQLRPLPCADQTADTTTTDPQQVLTETKEKVTQKPKPDDFIEATQVYDYLPGVVYEIIASPGHVTTIFLEPGEQLITKAAGNTNQWFVGDAVTGGKGEGSRTLLLVKPLKPNVETNLVISTDRRVYQIDLKSVPKAYHSEVRWNYPADLAQQVIEQHHAQEAAAADVLDNGVTLSMLDFNYRVRAKSKSAPDWMPHRVFTDGRKTYIGFPSNLAVMEAPPLFVLGHKDQAQLINYRVKANYYIVDRVIERAELRLGESPQEVVTIERTK